MKISAFVKLLMAFVFCLSMIAVASDYQKEKRWADQIVDSLFDGEPLNLHADDYSFLAIHTAPESTSSTGAILLHGTGVHPDWQTVINPVRVALAEQGIHSLSIQMPILENDAEQRDYIELFAEVPPRINAALAYYKEHNISNIYLIGHSLGASMGAYYLRNQQQNISGFIAIGLSTGIKDTAMDNLAHLTTISIPILDLYGSEDLENVVSHAQNRIQAANPDHVYDQIAVDGADHFFDGEENQLIDAVLNWLSPY